MPRRPDTPCTGCGKLLWRGSGCLPSDQRLCRDCRGWAPIGSLPERVACQWCGDEFAPARRRKGDRAQRFCSQSCGARAAVRRGDSKIAELGRSRGLALVPCPTCGEGFKPRIQGRLLADGSRVYYRQKFCSRECYLPSTGERRQRMSLRRRRRLLLALFERDGARCGVCSEPMDFGLVGTVASGVPTIDHIVPRSEGGDDDLANLRLAHMGCNASRGNRGGNEQLALVG